jgi:pimeloyl-ACP methyl ester carboxylesterase
MAIEGPERRLTTLGDGRALEYVMAGAADGPVVVFHHGSPGSSFAPRGLLDAATARGLRIVAASRSGYGGSSRDEGRSIAAVASDTAELLDTLGVDRFATAGWSGGGPHVLACAALLPERCVAALCVAGVAPYLPGEFDWTEGMGPENVEEFQLGLEAGPAYDEMLTGFREHLVSLPSTEVHSARELFGGLVSDVDEAASTPESVAFIVDNIAHGLAPGVGGWRDDDQSFLHDWGFDVRTITVPVGVWFGDQDLMVPARHGEWLGANVAGAKVGRFPDDGHISILERKYDGLLDGLLELAGARW